MMKKNIIKPIFVSFKTVIFVFFMSLTCSYVFSINYKAYRTASHPVIDGIANEDCWKTSKWALINQPFDGLTLPDSTDFYGRYKVAWDASRVYVLMEITDDKLIDTRTNPTDSYWNDDCAEFFIDEDHKAEGHECGVSAFNAFAYHVAAVARNKNSYTNGEILPFNDPGAVNHVVDLGSDCSTSKALNFDNHVNVKINKNGNKYTWELEFKIFDNSFNQNNSLNTPVNLTNNKVMGFAIAYCDDDTGVRNNMIGTIPNHNDYSGPYPFYRFTNEYGTLVLNDSILTAPASISSLKLSNSKLVWPNPVLNTLNIKSENFDLHFDNVQIVNMEGKIIFAGILNENNSKINVSFLHSGIYMLKLINKERVVKQLFIKQ